ncbi:MAG: hypothetical protein V4541_10685 [Bacteroidota bacterium]
MGIKPNWQREVHKAITALNSQALLKKDGHYLMIDCNTKLYIHLISLSHNFTPESLIELQDNYAKEEKLLVHLWEDVWLARQNQVLNRIRSFLGLNKTIHGRKTNVVIINQKQAQEFLAQYHLQGFVKAKYNYGLIMGSELVAVAGFSGQRPMRSKGPNYYSAELVRFASKNELTVVGGLSKLIQHHSKQVKINDIMTYADRDWSLGKGYIKLNFELSAITSPAFLYVNEQNGLRYFPHRLPKAILSDFETQNELDLETFMAKQRFVKIFNTGNLKYHLYI